MKEKGAIVFACDAGMGSSTMGAANFRARLKKEGIDRVVINTSIDEIPDDAAIVVTHQSLSKRAKNQAKEAEHITIQDFLHDPALEGLVNQLKESQNILVLNNIKLGLQPMPKEAAIQMAGDLLVAGGYVAADYVEAMQEREKQLSTYIGKGVAIPHGVGKAKEHILKSGIVVLQFPEGVDFDGERAYLVIGIAGVGNEHLDILSNIATVLEEDDQVALLRTTGDPQVVYEKFTVSHE